MHPPGASSEPDVVRAVARLAAGVAHDLNNLLTAMLGYAELLQNTLEPGDARWDDVAEIRKAGDRGAALTRHLLAVGRRSLTRPQPIDLNEIISRVAGRLLPLTGRRVALTVRRGEGLENVLADAEQIEHAVELLISHATRVTMPGGTVRVETANVIVDRGRAGAPAGSKAGRYVRLEVSDGSAGLTPEACSHFFEPYFSAEGRGKGAGLDLAAAHGIVCQAGGHFEVEGQPGKGTTIRVFLPARGEWALGSGL